MKYGQFFFFGIQNLWQQLAMFFGGKPSNTVMLDILATYILSSSTTYCEALGLAAALPGEDKKASTSQKVRARVGSLERAALAAHAYSVIQYARVGVFSICIHRISEIGDRKTSQAHLTVCYSLFDYGIVPWTPLHA